MNAAVLGAIAATSAAQARRRRRCKACQHTADQHRWEQGACRRCDCVKFADALHVPCGDCRVCSRSVYADDLHFALPGDAASIHETARALSRDPVCSHECAELASALEYPPRHRRAK